MATAYEKHLVIQRMAFTARVTTVIGVLAGAGLHALVGWIPALVVAAIGLAIAVRMLVVSGAA